MADKTILLLSARDAIDTDMDRVKNQTTYHLEVVKSSDPSKAFEIINKHLSGHIFFGPFGNIRIK